MQKYLKILGKRILSEANDLKRTPKALALETGVPLKTILSIIDGSASEEKAHDLISIMVQIYPISPSRLLVEKDDTNCGVLIMRDGDSKNSSRIFDRPNASGKLMPYYEYRDTAMSRAGPYKPEWIRPLRADNASDPYSADIAYNNGHLMHQLTFFIGQINFYWELNGDKYCREMNTGSSNYITPFVKHSFASKYPENSGFIIAVTYGDQVHQALEEFSHIASRDTDTLAGNLRNSVEALHAKINRQLESESLSSNQLIDRLTLQGIKRTRAQQLILDARFPTIDELGILAQALYVKPSDLMVIELTSEEELVLQNADEGISRSYPDTKRPTCMLTELVRSQHQPNLKGFNVSLIEGTTQFKHSLHEFIYNYGSAPVTLSWSTDKQDVINSGDSAYIRPMVKHALTKLSDSDKANLLLVRTPGKLTDSVLSEYSTYPSSQRYRVNGEDVVWF